MTAAKRVLTDAQRELLTRVLDRIVPAGGGLPGAGELGVGEFVESAAGSAPRQNRHSRESGNLSPTRLLLDGLKLIEVTGGGTAPSPSASSTTTPGMRCWETSSRHRRSSSTSSCG